MFEPFSYSQSGIKANIDIGYLNNTENRADDMKRARDKYRLELKASGVPKADSWPWPPTNSKGNAPAGWTWHHHQDGKTMVLIPTEIHKRMNHCGGVYCVTGN